MFNGKMIINIDHDIFWIPQVGTNPKKLLGPESFFLAGDAVGSQEIWANFRFTFTGKE